MPPLRTCSPGSRNSQILPKRRTRLIRTQRIGNEDIIPYWTAEEAREYIEHEYESELRRQINVARTEAKQIEKLVKDRDFRPFVQHYESFHRGDREWSFQKFMEDCLVYDGLEQQTKKAIERARICEMEMNRQRDIAARRLDEQNDLLLNMMQKGLYRDIQTDVRLQHPHREEPVQQEVIRIAGEGSEADPLEILE